METRLSGGDISFDASAADDEERASFAPATYLEDNRYNPEKLALQRSNEEDQHLQLGAALQRLDARSRDIVQRRWLSEEKETLTDLARKYNVSAERIRQLERNAFKTIKAHLQT